jgi:hypothetical protein
MRMLAWAASWRARTGAAVDRGGGGVSQGGGGRVGRGAEWVVARRPRPVEGGGRCGGLGGH